MLRIFYYTLLLLAAAVLTTGCADNCQRTYTHTVYTPVYMSYAEMRSASAVSMQAPTQLKDPGKIHLKDSYLYVNERGKGIHIINNADPTNPQKVGFLAIPGNFEIAVRGNTLYADSYVDLLVFNVSDITNPELTNRLENILPYEQFINGVWLDPSLGVVKEWVETEETVTVSCNDWGMWGGPVFAQEDMLSSNGGSSAGGSGRGSSDITNGVGGSMARFTLVDNYLYTAANNVLTPFDLTVLESPAKKQEVQVPMIIETLFPAGGNMYIGTPNGMYIYSLSNPAAPQYVSEYFHMTACDPVVVNGNYAYVTLRTGNFCEGFVNELHVVDLTNISNPVQAARYSMANPHGLGISGSSLFLCDGTAGLKVFDITDPLAISSNLIKQYEGMQATDVIPFAGKYLMMIGSDGLYQFDYSDINNIKQLSVIAVEK